MISSVPEDPNGTQHVPDGTQHVPDGTQHVPDGPAPSTETQFVPDGTLVANGRSPWARPDVPRAMGSKPPDQTQHVTDLPKFGRFRALAELGSGAMGTVYRAQDEVLGRSVAIKALASRDAGTRERFLREARAIGAVLHPNILAVYDAGTDDNTPYLVMELAAGGSLRDRIQTGALPIDTVRQIGIQISRALAAAHAANILHRDVKPANILRAPSHGSGVSEPGDTWKLADFGIARLPDSTLTVEGQFIGSPSYAAPESLRSGQFSPASDVYGLGATLYEALTGAPPHGDHDMQSVVRKLEQDAPPVHARRPVPGPLNDALMATLSRDPAKRPSAEQLAVLLANTSDDEPAVAPRGPSTRSKVIAVALAAVAIVLVVLAVTRKSPTAPSLQPALKPAQKVHSVPVKPNDDGADEPVEPSQPQPKADPWGTQDHHAVDPWGNPVDDETAQKMLEDMERDAREQANGFGRKRGKRRKH
jgi:serine/threonine-protein kinase